MVFHFLSALLEKLRCFVPTRRSIYFRKYSVGSSDLLRPPPDPFLVDRHALARLVAEHFCFSASVPGGGLRLDCLSTWRFVARLAIFCDGCSGFGHRSRSDHHSSRFDRQFLLVCSYRRR